MGYMRTEAGIGVMLPQPRNIWGCPKLEEAEKEGAWLCQHFYVRLVTSRTAREYVFAVLSHLMYGSLLWQPSEINIVREKKMKVCVED